LRSPLNLLAAVILLGLTACKEDGGRSETAAKPAAEMAHTGPGPSFDCSGSLTPAQKMVCEDAQLALLDREAARLLEVALSGPKATPDRSRSLREGHKLWLKGRDECEHARDLRECLTAAYAQRIYELRREFPDVRAANDSGFHAARSKWNAKAGSRQ
jgi:uncharacterized protein